uniref:Putative ovule protein n=1 Tax=Solanum chacoense TaxID=4108 RepID=A0A0V0GPC1_SOLCH
MQRICIFITTNIIIIVITNTIVFFFFFVIKIIDITVLKCYLVFLLIVAIVAVVVSMTRRVHRHTCFGCLLFICLLLFFLWEVCCVVSSSWILS